MMKRPRSDEQTMTESLATVADYLMLLSRTSPVASTTTLSEATGTTSRVFECKTCNRQFQSFQALGGHRASHKKPRLSDGTHSSDTSSNSNANSTASPPKPKTHECSFCGLEFAIGQALGGHMRRHRPVYTDGRLAPSTTLSLSLSFPVTAAKKAPAAVPKKAGEALCMDLNLTPIENGLEVAKLAAIFG